jgi:hypothetical protein
MNKLYLAVALIALLLSCQESKKSNANTENDAKWIALFDGSNTDHWRGAHMTHFPDSGWSISNGELLNDGSGTGNLVSKEEFSNFILEWEWRLFDEGGNSGLKYFVKETDNENGKSALGLEYQMIDEDNHPMMLEGSMTPNDYRTTGALYEFFEPSPEKKMAPLGEFNKSKIVSDGMHVEHWLNGIKIVEYERGSAAFIEAKAKSKFKDKPEFGLHDEGHLLLQDHSSRVGFRNIRIKIIN